MSRTSRYGFILAKVYGIKARSFVGKNFSDLLRLKKLADLHDALFPGEKVESPEQILPGDLEVRIVRAGIDAMIYVLDFLGGQVEILVHVLRKLEYQNVKTIIRGIRAGVTEGMRLWDLGEYAGIRLSGVKDYEKALDKSVYAWMLPHLKETPIAQVENMLDRDYYARLLSLASGLPGRDRGGTLRLATLEAALANVIWALRLRFYFGMDEKSARALLIPQIVKAQKTAIAQAFQIPPDSVEQWRNWRYGWLLDDQLGEAFQAPDPLKAEQKANQMLATRAHQIFHQSPFTLTPLVAYFKLKEYEISILKTAVEALQLALPEQEILSFVGTR
jgi:vacuolar-type H+-ATPase subunit C/Vma6